MTESTTATLITGASSGIGAAIARRLAKPNAALILAARRRENLERVGEECRKAGAAVTIMPADLAEPDGAAELARAVAAQFPVLHHLVSNAGYAVRAAVTDTPPVELARSFQVAAGAFQALLAGLRGPLVAARGSVVAISSFTAHRFRAAMPFAATAAARAAVEALVRSAAAELAAEGVRVNAVTPGLVRKDASGHSSISREQFQALVDQIPLGRLGLPDDIAGAVAFLLGPDAGYITGQTLAVDGGIRLG
jgi:3-oxoacyl-[acyl-carrier protein] reductase